MLADCDFLKSVVFFDTFFERKEWVLVWNNFKLECLNQVEQINLYNTI